MAEARADDDDWFNQLVTAMSECSPNLNQQPNQEMQPHSWQADPIATTQWLNESQLAQLLEKHIHSPDGLAVDICHNPNAFQATIDRGTVPPEIVRLAVRVAATICHSSGLRQHVFDLLDFLRNCPIFWWHIITTLKEMIHPPAASRVNRTGARKKSDTSNTHASPESEFVWHICRLVRSLAEYNGGVVGLPNDLLEDLIDVVNQHDGLRADYGPVLSAAAKQTVPITTPEFLPELAELRSDYVYPNIAPNIQTGPYDSVNHYIDSQLAFLREDFMGSLRSQIAEFHAQQCSEDALICIEAVPRPNRTLWSEVYFAVPANNWPLTPGHLLVFTSTMDGDMEDLVLAVVAPTNPDLQAIGFVQIEILNIERMVNVVHTPLVMIESELSFEQYNQLYLALSERRTLFPHHLMRELISASPKPPAASIPAPGYRDCNAVQAAAVQAAVQQRLTIIHGPPGTGKTFIGQQIVRHQLDNSSDRIVILCATEQKLDVLIDSVTELDPLVVRVGKTPENLALGRFNVFQLPLPLAHQLGRRIPEATEALCTARLQLIEELSIEDGPRSIDEVLRLRLRLDELRQLADAEKMSRRSVVAMTVTKAAKFRTLVRLRASTLVIVEEATGILEAQIVAALTPNVEQLVLIGDRQHPRPRTGSRHTTHDLHYDIPLIDRMLANGLASNPLTLNFRMNPLIADLLRATQCYEQLTEDATVLSRPPTTALYNGRNLLFFDHPHVTRSADGSDPIPAGVPLVRAVCEHIKCVVGIPNDKIVILTLNTNQATAIETRPGSCRGVRVAVLDDFLGCEAEVVLLSLGRRSADAANEHRVCVALSRAINALFIFGNMRSLTKRGPIWSRLRDHLVSTNSMGVI